MSKKLTYYLLVMGCQMNESDAERLETILNSAGYQKTNNEKEADLIGVLACAVRQAPMDRIYSRAHKWNLWKEKKPLITLLSGCVLQYDQKKLAKKFDIIIDIKDISGLPAILNENKKKIEQNTNTNYLQIAPNYESTFKAYVPIMTGCNKFCSYCAVPYTRGPEISRSSVEIFTEIKDLLRKGYKEITLLGQNVNSYGNDINDLRSPHAGKTEMSFPELLHEINSWDGDFWLRFTTSHPYDMSDELIAVMAEQKHLAEYLHLPVQSGNSEVLKKMNRHYTIEHYLERLEKVRQRIPEIALSTDIIVGFCGETNQQFMDTARLMEQVGYDMAYISQYSPRPGTGAARAFQDDISRKEKKIREKYLTEILKKTAKKYHNKFIGKTTKVLVDNIKNQTSDVRSSGHRMSENILTGKNREFKNIQFKGNKKLIGQFVDVKITSATPWALDGKLVE